MMDDKEPRGIEGLDGDIDAAMDFLGKPEEHRPAVADRGARMSSSRLPAIAPGRGGAFPSRAYPSVAPPVPGGAPATPPPMPPVLSSAPNAATPPSVPGASSRGSRGGRGGVVMGRARGSMPEGGQPPSLPNRSSASIESVFGDLTEAAREAIESVEGHPEEAEVMPMGVPADAVEAVAEDADAILNDIFGGGSASVAGASGESESSADAGVQEESPAAESQGFGASGLGASGFELFVSESGLGFASGLGQASAGFGASEAVAEPYDAVEQVEQAESAYSEDLSAFESETEAEEVSEQAGQVSAQMEALAEQVQESEADFLAEEAAVSALLAEEVVMSELSQELEAVDVEQDDVLASEVIDEEAAAGGVIEKGPAFEIKPIPEDLRAEAYLRDNGSYRNESRRLLRTQNWAELTQVMSNVLTYAQWANLPEVRSSILSELAGIYGERIGDKAKEESTYAQLLREDPANQNALSYMQGIYEARGDFRGIYDMYRRVVDAVWETEDRIFYTQKAADVAELSLRDSALMIAVWEHLWSLGENSIAVQGALMTAYRNSGRWEKLAAFIGERCVNWGRMERLGLREIVEIYISGMSDAERARAVLDVLLKQRPADPLLLLQEVNVCRLSGDIDKLATLSRMSGVQEVASRDIQRAVADVLWDKGERELAVQAYDALLDIVPEDRDALNAKELYYKESGNYDILCHFYEMRAEEALNEHRRDKACEWYRKAAEVAESLLFDNERAILIWKRIISEDPEETLAHQKVIALYESMGDDEGVAASLEGLLALTSRPAARREILSRLGHVYLDKLGDYAKAEQCWQRVQVLDPRNHAVNDVLSRVYAKQGDFEALDRNLTQQIRVADEENVLALAEAKGRYLMEHSPSSAHTAAGWEIVLDFVPHHGVALASLASVSESLHRDAEMIGALEQALKSAETTEEKVSLGLRIADACVHHATHSQAVAAYLRVLCWEPGQARAIDALSAICSEAERGIICAVLEVAATLPEDKTSRCAILRDMLRFIPSSNVTQRLLVMRRMLVLGDDAVMSDLIDLCQSSGRRDVLAAIYLREAYEREDRDKADKMLCDIARLSADSAEDASRAFTLLFASALDVEKAKALLTELEALAPKTERWEEVIAVLGCLSSPGSSQESRREAILRRIEILSEKLAAPDRVMEEYRRLLGMMPEDADILAQAEAVARAHDLYEALIAIYGEVWDATSSAALRSEISEKRYHIYKDILERDDDALHELFLGYRFAPAPELEARLMAQARVRDKSALCVPLLESDKRARREVSPASLKALAEIYETVLASEDGAFALYLEVLTSVPGDEEVLEKLTALVENNEAKGAYAQALRLAASQAHQDGDDERSLALYHRLASYYQSGLDDMERSIDVQRRILRLDPGSVASLDALMAWHESRGEWSDLRSEIKQRIAAGASDQETIALWLRIAEISRDQINDLESAFDAYAEILQIDESDETALKGIADLTSSDFGPEVTLRKLRLELKLADSARRPNIMLQIASLLSEALSQNDAACEMLEKLHVETGPLGIGYEPLCRMYERQRAWAPLVKLMMGHADALSQEGDEVEAAATLNQALAIVDEKLHEPELSTSIIERLRAIDPENEEIFERYCKILRSTENWERYAEVMQEVTANVQTRGASSRQRHFFFELARLQNLAIGKPEEAIKTYRTINRSGSVERNAYLGMATVALKLGDIDLYLNALDQVLRLADPVWGAIYCCHMAEVCDEKDRPTQVANHYRSARMLDPNNVVASESLRSIGRRLKNWRTTSALLPLENERQLSWAERSDKLVEFSLRTKDIDEARQWLWKAIAVCHDNIRAWQELALLEARAGRHEGCYGARLGALGALERTSLPSPENALRNAQFMHEVALAAIDCGKDARAEGCYRKAYSMAPNYAPVAIAVADLEQDSGNLDKAYAIYDAILKDKTVTLDDKTRADVLFRRGLIANIQQNYTLALDDLRATVKMTPLHFDALTAISKTYTEIHQPLLALFHLQQSLLVTPDHAKRRGNILYEMGKLWGDVFGDVEEAGIYYEGALDNGASDVDLVERSLEIYKAAGRYHEALELVATLTKTTTDPRILSRLWCTRGELSESISTDEATEAYDMALSYAPGMPQVLDGLERMLVARQEWHQLADLLRGRLESEHSPQQEADILMRLADLYGTRLDDPENASEILYRVLDFCPSAEVVERLLATTSASDVQRRIPLLEKAVRFCTNRYQYAIEIAQYHLAQGRELQAWAILSPLRVLLQVEPGLKEILNDLKGKFEKGDALVLDRIASVQPSWTDEQFAILNALQVVHERIGTLGPKSLDDITSGASEVSEFTPNGKSFHQMRGLLGIENVSLWRSVDLPEAIVVIDAEPTIVCIRTEVFQKAAGNELQFWLAKGLGMAHPDVRTIASTPLPWRQQLAKAILAAAGIGQIGEEADELTTAIQSKLTSDDVAEIASQLSLYDSDKLLAAAETFSRDMLALSDLLGAFSVADMRTVWRAESRMNPSIPEQRSVKTVEEISAAIEASDTLSKILTYYVSSDFDKNLSE
ncbi:MAG: hypothetical protein FWC40_03875 [Proteobacteria bacterium]|nr:hypothetical protein [Pseudomonadota bacterium]